MTNTKTVDFVHGFTLGEDTVVSITLREPDGGSMRGLTMRSVHDMEWDTIMTLASRLALGNVPAAALERLRGPDMIRLTEAIITFFGDDASPTTH
jgi:hypothetical protein